MIDDLLVELNDRRKFEAYGDIELPENEDRDAQDTAAEIRAYFEAVEAVLGPARTRWLNASVRPSPAGACCLSRTTITVGPELEPA